VEDEGEEADREASDRGKQADPVPEEVAIFQETLRLGDGRKRYSKVEERHKAYE